MITESINLWLVIAFAIGLGGYYVFLALQEKPQIKEKRKITIAPIKTELGEFHGRTAFFLHDEEYDSSKNKLCITGEVDGNPDPEELYGELFTCEIEFKDVSKWSKVRIDDWRWYGNPKCHEISSFNIVIENGVQTYILETYDWAYEVQCESYDIKFVKIT
ncbi:hypothetical protein [Microbulbifer guangxiensis]|uniref:hypothetical protein n=1 Tax=Microbulbifer guangxiensis TaxID=2904249 RepID=UPI001F15FF8A|nr:hypothetical protein [Microbulbifer guangxiensis]